MRKGQVQGPRNADARFMMGYPQLLSRETSCGNFGNRFGRLHRSDIVSLPSRGDKSLSLPWSERAHRRIAKNNQCLHRIMYRYLCSRRKRGSIWTWRKPSVDVPVSCPLAIRCELQSKAAAMANWTTCVLPLRTRSQLLDPI
jgi:hypothetical protein